MALTDMSVPFRSTDTEDPAIPGDPWTRLRFLYGQLLSADDFSSEQRATVLRRRLHNALLHGAGTVCGLRVLDGPEGEPEPRPEIVVEEGLAIDALGREIYVDQAQCLDVADLHDSRIWDTLEVIDDTGDRTVKRAYVILSYLACLSGRIAVIQSPCSHEEELRPFGRVNDRFRIDLVEAPPDPELIDLQKAWLSSDGGSLGAPDDAPASPRAALLEHILGGTGDVPLSAYWLQDIDAPLLLATVDLLHEEAAGVKRTGVLAVDNSPRALLPSAQVVAEQVFGQRLVGRDERTPLNLVLLKTNEESASAGDAAEFELRFSSKLMPLGNAALRDIVTLLVVDGDTWKDALEDLQVDTELLKVKGSAGAFNENTVFQLRVRGRGAGPLVGAEGEALAGLAIDGVPIDAGGRDISIIRQWRPGA